jgi:hypothetical protein
VSSRGWCYILEEHGLGKGDFDAAQNVINECRKGGLLPLNICSEDDTRSFDGLESLDSLSPEVEASAMVGSLRFRHRYYTPFSFWQDQDHYLQMMVEKIDLKTLFTPVCRQFYVPIANCRGWSDINSRADMMRRFAEHEDEGRQCVLLYCGDHDPVGLTISDALRSNMRDLAAAVGWAPETGSGRRLDDPKHPDHGKPYVQDYLRAFGARKVEANALVVRPAAARELCRDAVLRYLSPDAAENYRDALKQPREELRMAILSALQEASRGEASP